MFLPSRVPLTKRLRATALVLVALFAFVGAACGGESSDGGPAAGGGDGLEKTKVVVGWAHFANNTVAHRLPEFAAKHGLEVENLIVRSGADLLTAVLDGSADTGVLTYSYMFQAMDQGKDMVAISSNMKGGTRILVGNDVAVEPGDFEGLIKLAEERAAAGDKLVLVGASASINYAIGYLSLQENGVDVEELFDFQDVLDPGLHAQMLQSGDADVVIIGEPGAALAVLNGWGRTFHYPYDSALGAMNTEWLSLRSFVDESPNTARALVAAIKETADYLADNKEENVKAVVEFAGIGEPIAREAFNNYTIDPALDPDAATTAAEFLYEAGLVQEDHSAEAAGQVLVDLQS